jgi:hypothetical protein
VKSIKPAQAMRRRPDGYAILILRHLATVPSGKRLPGLFIRASGNLCLPILLPLAKAALGTTAKDLLK